MPNQVKFSAGPRPFFNCRGSYCCKNTLCKNIIDFVVNCRDVKRLNDRTICALCEKEGLFISCDASLILKEHLVNKIVTCKHFGIQVREKFEKFLYDSKCKVVDTAK